MEKLLIFTISLSISFIICKANSMQMSVDETTEIISVEITMEATLETATETAMEQIITEETTEVTIISSMTEKTTEETAIETIDSTTTRTIRETRLEDTTDSTTETITKGTFDLTTADSTLGETIDTTTERITENTKETTDSTTEKTTIGTFDQTTTLQKTVSMLTTQEISKSTASSYSLSSFLTTLHPTFLTTSTPKPTICLQNYCLNGGSCLLGVGNCDGESICCNCTTDYLQPFCETRATHSVALSMTIDKTFTSAYENQSSLEFKSISYSICNLMKSTFLQLTTSPIICILTKCRPGSIILDVIIKGNLNLPKNISSIRQKLQNACQNEPLPTCATLQIPSLVENSTLYDVCPNGVPITSATTCSPYSQCQGNNMNAAIYICKCKSGFRDSYTGINSDYQGLVCTEICTQSSCQNGGTCVEQTGTTLKCLCPSGTTGDKCESNSNGNRTIVIVFSVLGSLAIVIVVVIIFFCYKKQIFKHLKKDSLHEMRSQRVYEESPSDYYYSSYALPASIYEEIIDENRNSTA